MPSKLLFGIVASAIIFASCAQSDTGITTSVKSQLAADDAVKARKIEVETHNRVVTLKGEVRTADEESRALEIARRTNGVTDVVDQLAVVADPEVAPTTGVGEPTAPDVTPRAGDAAITAAVKAKLLADPDTSGLRIDVDTQNGIVTLKGKVRSEAEKIEALGLARQTEGVSNVTDLLTVEPRR